MKILIVSDTHFYNGWGEFSTYDAEHNGLNSRFVLQMKAFGEALHVGRSTGCTSLVILGDLFHKRGQVEPEVVNMLKVALTSAEDFLESVIILTGNHDITAEGDLYNTANILSGLNVPFPVTTICERTFAPSNGFLFVPFTADQEAFNEMTAPESLTKNMAHVTLFMHQSVFGAEYNRPITKGADPKKLHRFKRVFCGHIHQPQNIQPNIHIVGAPYPMNFGDNYQGGCTVYDSKTNTVTWHRLQHPLFKTTNNPNAVDDYNFWRVNLPPNVRMDKPNVRVVAQTVTKSVSRVDSTDLDDLMKHHVNATVTEKDARKTLFAFGKKLFKEAQDA